ncbi:MAG TPA: tRNA (adenosine(37)-N6)-threonylcarbamoyltransferase complex transferase subunit TsaD [bacterium]|nr:tRNA (adenosine(37)-N6)-threonylcarbamoyltransferase complex transferase subunit TsaD [bacterium]
MILGIETSCDDTSAAVYDGRRLLSNVISTQLIHRNFGGVVPELASRSHIPLILPVIRQALDQAGISKSAIEGLAVTHGPGLAGSLLVGLSTAKGLSLGLGIPFAGINHLEGHIWANELAHPEIKPPFVVLIVSGGHTQVVHVPEWGTYRVLGRTRDDAAGEAFDKVGKLLEAGYPGGPVIERLARDGDPEAVRFPRAYLGEDSLDFSFSGLKTAVLNFVRKHGLENVKKNLPNIAAGFQSAVLDVLVDKILLAVRLTGVKTACLAGGVAANRALQQRLLNTASQQGVSVFWPPPALCSDNAGMIARAGYFYLSRGDVSPQDLSPRPALNL